MRDDRVGCWGVSGAACGAACADGPQASAGGHAQYLRLLSAPRSWTLCGPRSRHASGPSSCARGTCRRGTGGLHHGQPPAELHAPVSAAARADGREMAWFCWRIVELCGRVPVGPPGSLSRWMAETAADHPNRADRSGSSRSATPAGTSRWSSPRPAAIAR